MADCLVCTDNYTVEEIIRLVTVCDGTGSVAFRIKTVLFSDDCMDCGIYKTTEELLRNSLWCDENGVFYIQVVTYISEPQ